MIPLRQNPGDTPALRYTAPSWRAAAGGQLDELVRLRAIGRKILHVFRDRLSLAIAVALPLILIIIFGFALSFDVKHVPLVVWDQSETQLSRELISQFTGSPYFRLVDYARNYPEVERAVDSGQALLALVISRDFAAHLESGRPAAVQLIADGGDSNTATIALGYANAVARGFSQQIAVQQVQQQRGLTLQPPIDLRPRVWFKRHLESRTTSPRADRRNHDGHAAILTS